MADSLLFVFVAFIIQTRSGLLGTDLVLVLKERLDRERMGSYTLKLVARDKGQPSRYHLNKKKCTTICTKN